MPGPKIYIATGAQHASDSEQQSGCLVWEYGRAGYGQLRRYFSTQANSTMSSRMTSAYGEWTIAG